MSSKTNFNDLHEDVKASILQGLKEVELHKQGRIKLRSWDDLIIEMKEWDIEIEFEEDRFEYIGVYEVKEDD